jgi:hypothetical protein
MRFDGKVSHLGSPLPCLTEYFTSQVVIPIQFVLFTLSAIIGSAILYGDFQKATFHEIITFFYGCAATFAGVFIIAWGPNQSKSDPDCAGESEDGTPNASDPQQTAPEGSRHGSARRKKVIPADVAGLKDGRNRSISIIGISPAQVSKSTLQMFQYSNRSLCSASFASSYPPT